MELSTMLNVKSLYKNSNDYLTQGRFDRYGTNSRMGYYPEIRELRIAKMYEFLNTFRPDLLDKPLVKDEYQYAEGKIDKLREGENSVIPYDWKSSPLEMAKLFNYSVEELANLMVEFHKDQKFTMPKDYQVDWRDRLGGGSVSFKVGDEVEYTDKRGNTKIYIIDKIDEDGDYADLQEKDDDTRFVDDVDVEKINLITKERDKLDDEFYEPFDPLLEKNAEKVWDFMMYHLSLGKNYEITDNKLSVIYNHLGVPTYHDSSDRKKSLKERRKIDDSEIVEKRKAKWTDIITKMKERYYNGSGYTPDLIRGINELKKTEQEILIPQWINNQQELTEKIESLID